MMPICLLAFLLILRGIFPPPFASLIFSLSALPRAACFPRGDSTTLETANPAQWRGGVYDRAYNRRCFSSGDELRGTCSYSEFVYILRDLAWGWSLSSKQRAAVNSQGRVKFDWLPS